MRQLLIWLGFKFFVLICVRILNALITVMDPTLSTSFWVLEYLMDTYPVSLLFFSQRAIDILRRPID